MSSTNSTGPNSKQAQRKAAMSVLAHSAASDIAGRLAAITLPGHENLREPENGLVMMRGRVGGDGAPFNLGEATVSRAAVRLASGEVGFGYTLGRDAEKARMIALCDAMVQSAELSGEVEAKVIAPLRAAMNAERSRKAAETAATRVDFYTMVRGEDDAMTTIAEMPAGFADKVLSAQSTFRSVMDAMARPGSVQRVAASVGTPAGLMRGAAAIALTLFDHDTPIWLDAAMSATPDVARWLKFHASAPVVEDSSIASFALIGDAANLPALECFAFGSGEYPDRSTTLILQIDSLTQGPAFELKGPGIDGSAVLQAMIKPRDLFQRLSINEALFPRGIDVVLVHDDNIVAIPRTTRLIASGV